MRRGMGIELGCHNWVLVLSHRWAFVQDRGVSFAVCPFTVGLRCWIAAGLWRWVTVGLKSLVFGHSEVKIFRVGLTVSGFGVGQLIVLCWVTVMV